MDQQEDLPLEKVASIDPKKRNHQLVSWSLGAGLCALIPIPFVDDWAVKKVREAAYAATWRKHSHQPSPKIRKATTNGRKTKRGCIGILFRIPIWAMKWLIFYPVKKILRKLFFIFAIHDAVNVFSDCYHCTYLFDSALTANRAPTTEEEAFVLHDAIHTVCRKAESRPIIQLIQTVFNRGGRKLRTEGLRLYRIIRKDQHKPQPDERLEEAVESESVSLTPISQELENSLLLEKGYFDALSRNLLATLSQNTSSPSDNTTSAT